MHDRTRVFLLGVFTPTHFPHVKKTFHANLGVFMTLIRAGVQVGTESLLRQSTYYWTGSRAVTTISTQILKNCWPRWPINFLLNSSDLKRRLFLWLLHVTELTVEMVQYIAP